MAPSRCLAAPNVRSSLPGALPCDVVFATGSARRRPSSSLVEAPAAAAPAIGRSSNLSRRSSCKLRSFASSSEGSGPSASLRRRGGGGGCVNGSQLGVLSAFGLLGSNVGRRPPDMRWASSRGWSSVRAFGSSRIADDAAGDVGQEWLGDLFGSVNG